MVSVPCYRCNRYHRIVPLVIMLVISRMGCYYGPKIIPSFFTIKEGTTFLSKPLFNSLYAPFGSPSSGGQKPSGTRGCNRPTVLYLPHLSLPSGRVLNPLPSPRPFQKGKGCNRPPVLRTATLYGCRTIKGLRHVVRDGTAWGKVDRIIEVLVLW